MYRRIEVVMTQELLKEYGGRIPTMIFAADSMVKSGLSSPRKISFQREKSPKYFFTEKGWEQCGHNVLTEIRAKGLMARIISVKENDRRINILYKDALQALITFSGRPKDIVEFSGSSN